MEVFSRRFSVKCCLAWDSVPGKILQVYLGLGSALTGFVGHRISLVYYIVDQPVLQVYERLIKNVLIPLNLILILILELLEFFAQHKDLPLQLFIFIFQFKYSLACLVIPNVVAGYLFARFLISCDP